MYNDPELICKKGDLSGTLLAGRYRLKELLGSGSQGSVYLAEDTKIGIDRAVKLIHGITGDELTALKAVSHPAFPRIVDVTECNGDTALIMDYIKGVSLSEYARDHTINVDLLSKWALEIAEAIRYLHSITPAILYLDCKPSNIMLGEDGRLYLVDLGSAYVTGLSGSHRISGTLPYAASEQRRGIRVDTRSDIYAFGMTLKILGHLPDSEFKLFSYLRYRSRPDRRLQALCVIVNRCISDDPGLRYQSTDDLIYHLTHPARIGYRLPSAGYVIRRLSDILYKNVVTAFSILSYKMYSHSHDPVYMLLGTVLFILLVSLCLRRRSDTYPRIWHCCKDIYLHDLAGALLLIVLCSLLNKDYGYAASYVRDDDLTDAVIPDVTIYDAEGAKVLYRGQYVVSDGDSLYLYIPADSLGSGHIPARVEVR